MRRRDFIKVIAGSAVVWPPAARAQQRAFPVVGLLSARSPDVDTPLIAVIRQGLNEASFSEGRNLMIEYRWAEGKYDRLPAMEGVSAGGRTKLPTSYTVTGGGKCEPCSDAGERLWCIVGQ